MTMTQSSQTTSTLQKLLTQEDASLSLAECQGCLTGLSCSGLSNFEEEVLPQIAPLLSENGNLTQELMEQLKLCHSDIIAELKDDSSAFELFISKDKPSQQLSDLSRWCEGWLLGHGISDSKISYSDEVKEGIRDIRDISQVDYEEEIDQSEEDDFEKDFFQLLSHIRVIIELVFLESQQQHKLNSLAQISENLH